MRVRSGLYSIVGTSISQIKTFCIIIQNWHYLLPYFPALQNTLGRLFIIYNSDNPSHPQIATISLDVSHSGEFLYIYKRILSRPNLNFSKLVIDVGANDGILSSNSFGFIQLGWNALLVEPLQNQIDFAKRNLERYVKYGYVSMPLIKKSGLVCNSIHIESEL